MNYNYKITLTCIKSSTTLTFDSGQSQTALYSTMERFNSIVGGNRPQLLEIRTQKNYFEILFSTQKELKEPVRALKDFLSMLSKIEPFCSLKIGNSHRIFKQLNKAEEIKSPENEAVSDSASNDDKLLALTARALFDTRYADKHNEFKEALTKLLQELNIQ